MFFFRCYRKELRLFERSLEVLTTLESSVLLLGNLLSSVYKCVDLLVDFIAMKFDIETDCFKPDFLILRSTGVLEDNRSKADYPAYLGVPSVVALGFFIYSLLTYDLDF